MTDATETLTGRRATGSPVQAAAAVVSLLFLLVGALGFVPGITAGHDGLHAAGPDSHAELFGLFQVSGLHNVLHLVLGGVGLALTRTSASARAYLLGGGATYLVLCIYGLVVDTSSQANFVPLNGADNWLHLVLGVLMVGLGIALGRPGVARRPR